MNQPCTTPGCDKDAEVVGCVYPDDTLAGDFCAEHATAAGFCSGCGHFAAGVESFDFSPVAGLCAECLDDLRGELGEYDDGDEYDDYDEQDYYDDDDDY